LASSVRHTIIHQLDPERHVVGGIDGFIHDVLTIGARRHRLRVIGVTSPDSDRRLGETVRLPGARGGEIEFVPVARLRAGDQGRRIPHSAQLVAGLARYRPDVAGDIVHLHRADVAWAARPLLRHALLRVLFVHGSTKEALVSRVETFWRFAPRLNAYIERSAARSAGLGYVMHAHAAVELARANPRMRHGRNWFDDEVFFAPAQRPPTRERHIVWAGRLEPQKDPDLALHTVGALNSNGLDVQVCLAGEGTLRAELTERRNALGLADSVAFAGALSPAQLAERMRGSHLFLLTSRWEGIPRVVLEALACGLPVVSTPAGDVAAMVPEGMGELVTERDGAVVAAAVARTLQGSPGPAQIAASVEHLRASVVVPALLDEITTAATDS
jgi:glycosyltransferase involved in cell wall biosynthesis